MTTFPLDKVIVASGNICSTVASTGSVEGGPSGSDGVYSSELDVCRLGSACSESGMEGSCVASEGSSVDSFEVFSEDSVVGSVEVSSSAEVVVALGLARIVTFMVLVTVEPR